MRLLAFVVFRPTESAQWIAILVFAYGDGGTGEMGIAAVALLVPTALLAPFVSQLGDRIHRERALALGYLAIGVAAGLVAASPCAVAADPVVYVFAAVAHHLHLDGPPDPPLDPARVGGDPGAAHRRERADEHPRGVRDLRRAAARGRC